MIEIGLEARLADSHGRVVARGAGNLRILQQGAVARCLGAADESRHNDDHHDESALHVWSRIEEGGWERKGESRSNAN